MTDPTTGLKINFHDQNKRRTYIKLAEMMRRAKIDPSLIDTAQAFVEQHMMIDPHQRNYAEHWMMLLRLPVSEIAGRLLADTPEGDLLRDTAPVFGKGLTSREIVNLIEHTDA
jgi:hypothetical protein